MISSTTAIMLFVAVLFFHWIADFIFQTDEMAKMKATSIKWLTTHVFVYSVVMYILTSSLTSFWLPNIWTFEWIFTFFTYVFVTHWITDFFTSKATKWLYERDERHWFFVVIGFDQWLHFLALGFILTRLFH